GVRGSVVLSYLSFFFSSRRRHTRCYRDWSSDVCSSDLVLEVGIFLALGLSGFASPGPGGFNFSSLNPNNLPSVNGLYLGVVFTILALSGFEAVAPLAEETENPRRNLPIAIVGSVLLVAIFYALVNWGVLVGHGTTDVA